MIKFNQLTQPKLAERKEEKKTIFKNEDLKIIKFEKNSLISTKDIIVFIPYLIQDNQIIIKQEYIPAYKYVDNQELHVSLITAIVNKDESPEESLLRELQEIAGIVVRSKYKIEINKPLFLNKNSINKVYFSILPLMENDYNEISVNRVLLHPLDKVIKLDLRYINSINASDIITELLIEKFKNTL
jgi:hypothetical protein